MQRRSPKLLEDIRDAADFIREATQGPTLDDYLLRQAIERNFEIIGEAIKRLVQHDHKPPPASVTTSRSSPFATHGYDLVDHARVWSTIENQVATLFRDVEVLPGMKR